MRAVLAILALMCSSRRSGKASADEAGRGIATTLAGSPPRPRGGTEAEASNGSGCGSGKGSLHGVLARARRGALSGGGGRDAAGLRAAWRSHRPEVVRVLTDHIEIRRRAADLESA